MKVYAAAVNYKDNGNIILGSLVVRANDDLAARFVVYKTIDLANRQYTDVAVSLSEVPSDWLSDYGKTGIR